MSCHSRKRSCWSWYIFPTAPYVVNGIERGSWTNKRYALRDKPDALTGDNAAKAFLRHPEMDGVDLRQNYILIMTAVAEQVEAGVSVRSLVGFLDDPKLRSSLRFFERISRNGFDNEVHAVCVRALEAMDESIGDVKSSQVASKHEDQDLDTDALEPDAKDSDTNTGNET